jgi:general secretion pathway protein D
VTKVPLLGDIPLLGYFFKYVSDKKTKTNLLILLTPHIIQEPGVASKALEERQRKMLNAFDPNRDEVKRALPESRGEKQP